MDHGRRGDRNDSLAANLTAFKVYIATLPTMRVPTARWVRWLSCSFVLRTLALAVTTHRTPRAGRAPDPRRGVRNPIADSSASNG